MKKTKPNKEKRVSTFIVLAIMAVVILLGLIIVHVPENITRTKEILLGEKENLSSENKVKQIKIGELDLKLEITKGNSPLKNGWYNSEEVEVTLTVENEIEESQIKEKGIVYGTRLKGSEEIPTNLKKLENKAETIIITEEGITEIVVYSEAGEKANENNKQAEAQTMYIQIDRTPPTIDSLKCTQIEDNKITMVAEGTRDNDGGSGVEEYVFFTENDASPDKIMRSGTNEISFNTSIGVNLGTVVVYDKAGNPTTFTTQTVSTGNSTGLYVYEIFSLINPTSDSPRCAEHLWKRGEENVTLALRNSNTLVRVRKATDSNLIAAFWNSGYSTCNLCEITRWAEC